ncbi:MAG TPA: glycoside hydrolase family 3 C-terminal domain-containing protein, partial [Polyangiaceae bacterium]
GFDAAIVVFGEDAYAEGMGNVSDPTLSRVVPESTPILNRVNQLGLPTVVVVLSGRPLAITDLFSKADAWVAAWLPGSAGQGVADVLFGDYAPTGRLSHSWPNASVQIPINVGDEDYTTDPPLFEYGYGLTY